MVVNALLEERLSVGVIALFTGYQRPTVMRRSEGRVHEISAGDQAALARDQIFQQGDCPSVVSFGARLQRLSDDEDRFVLALAQRIQACDGLFEQRSGARPI